MKNRRGISLIVLVITIIIMVILAAAIILSLTNSGIIENAKEAREKTDDATIREMFNVEYGNYTIEKEAGKDPASEENFNSYMKDKLKKQGISEESLKDYIFNFDGTIQKLELAPDEWSLVVAKVIDTVPIPKGFEYIKGTKDNGLVIKDTTTVVGNEFVWIPCPITETGTYTSLESYRIQGNNSNAFYDTIADELYKNIEDSIKKYGGFYVARYEAGVKIDTENGPSEGNPVLDGSVKFLSQKDKYPWSKIPFDKNWSSGMGNPSNPGAALVAYETYKASTSVRSSLMYGAQWDAMLRFMGVQNETDSTSWGNYKNTTYTLTNTSARYSTNYGVTYNNITENITKATSVEWLLTTGANEKFSKKNIYDISGNLWEWTLEVYRSDYRAMRGGSYVNDGNVIGNTAAHRSYGSPNKTGNCGFHSVLYIL